MSDHISFLPPEDMNPEFVISAMSESMDWGLVMAGVGDAHKHTCGEGIVVAVLDTGGPNHNDIVVNLLPAQNATTAPLADDKQGHGTHCAGIIAAAENGEGIIGIAPKAKILPIKVLNDNGRSGYQEIERGIRLATAAGVDIISMSLGAPQAPPDSLHDAIKEAAARGIILIAAAGNDSGAVNYPAKYPEVIAVGAMDQQGNLAGFSSRGSEISVIAPGVDIYSTYTNQRYAVLNGTSQACPFIAGVCALMLAWVKSNPSVPPIRNYQDMLQRLDDMSDPVGRIGFHGKMGDVGFGVPSFANFMAWKQAQDTAAGVSASTTDAPPPPATDAK